MWNINEPYDTIVHKSPLISLHHASNIVQSFGKFLIKSDLRKFEIVILHNDKPNTLEVEPVHSLF